MPLNNKLSHLEHLCLLSYFGVQLWDHINAPVLCMRENNPDWLFSVAGKSMVPPTQRGFSLVLVSANFYPTPTGQQQSSH